MCPVNFLVELVNGILLIQPETNLTVLLPAAVAMRLILK